MRINKTTNRFQADRRGFTLTEMLVATALVVLIMLMFAQIYGSAVGSIREQRGLANNDQKARIIETTLRQDLQSMTYRQPDAPYGNVQGIVAMASGDELIIDPTHQRGYFFFDENDGANDQDDILQFTVQIRGNQRGDIKDRLNANRFVGKALNLGGNGTNDNEPERDDGIDGNSQGSSSAAEVCYFLRGGNLYRRMLLLRDPIQRAVPVDSQPTQNIAQTRMFQVSGGTIGADYPNPSFYRDFDYAATRVNGALWFHSVDSLPNNMGERNVPIALPKYRFGFNSSGVSIDQDSANNHFGRFTLQETSDDRFDWPGNIDTYPYVKTNLTLNDTSLDDNEFLIDQYNQNHRVAEDILLTNVEAFDVQIMNPNPATDDNDPATNNDQVFYSPPISPAPGANSPLFTAEIFDTWHPEAPGTSPSRKVRIAEADIVVRNNSNNGFALSGPPVFIAVPALNPTNFTTGNFDNISFIYRLVSGGGDTGDTVPEFPPVLGNIVQDGDVQWECIDNRVALKAIRITVRYRDVGSSLPRQVSIVHSFVE